MDSNLQSITPRLPAIVQSGYHLVENINNFPTLTRLTATCKTFKDLIDGRPTLMNQLFDELEKDSQVNGFPTCKGDDDCWCNYVFREFSCVSALPNPPGESAITKYCPDFDKTAWLPCYGCRKVKKIEEFDHNHQNACFDLHGCRHMERRCKTCFEEARANGTEIAVDTDGVLTIKDQPYRTAIEADVGLGERLRELIRSSPVKAHVTDEAEKKARLDWMLSVAESHGCCE